MSNRFRLAIAFGFCAAVSATASAQVDTARAQPDTSITQVLRLRDGSTIIGRLLARDSTSLQFATTGGVLTIPAASVLDIRAVKKPEIHDGEYWFPDANSTRLFFAPTGRMLEQGEGYYSNTYLLLQNFVGAPTNNFTFGGGFSIIPSDNFFQDNVYYLTPKLGVYASPTTNAAVGALVGVFPGSSGVDRRSESFGILYGVVTRGGPNASMTAGLGYGYTNGSLAQRPLLMIGGTARTARRITLVTENYAYFLRDDNRACIYQPGAQFPTCTSNPQTTMHAVFSYGLRFMGEKISTDLALFNVSQDPVFPGIPYISFAVKF